MQILQLHTRYRQPGGEDAVVNAERTALERAGHHVRQHIVMNPAGTLAAMSALAGSPWNPRAAARVLADVATARPDVAHVHNTWFAMSPSVLAALRRQRVPVVMTVHNYRIACSNSLFFRDGAPCEKCLDGGAWSAVRHACYRGSRSTSAIAAAGVALHRGLGTWARCVDRFVVLSEFARGKLLRMGLPEDRLVLGANFVEDPGPRARPPSASSDVLFVGRLSREKGLHVLLAAWREALLPGMHLTVLGDGPDRIDLERSAPRGVTFLGRRSGAEVLARLQRSRALVLPSVWYEGQPVAALEGCATGTPLVLSGIGGLGEVIGGSDAGWISPPQRPQALARCLEELVNDSEVDRRGAAARRRYLKAFTPAVATERLENVYAQAKGVGGEWR